MANTTIKLKANTTNAGAVPGSGVLAVGELALNTVDKVLYSKAANGTVIIVGTGADSQNVATQITVGNSTVNTAITAGQISFANSTSNTKIAIPTAAQYTAGNYYLNANGSWVVVSGGSGTPTGSNTAIQFNDSGAFGGNLDFTWNKTTDQMALGNSTVTTSPSIKLQNSTVSFTMTIPTSTQAAATNYFLAANGSWLTVTGGGSGNTVFVRQNYTATAGQNTFTVSGGYTVGQLDVYLNGVKLLVGSDVAASNGTGIQLTVNASNNDIIEVVGFANVTAVSSTGGSSDKYILFNDGGSVVNGTAAMTFTKTSNTLSLDSTTTLIVGNSTVNTVINSTSVTVSDTASTRTLDSVRPWYLGTASKFNYFLS